LCGPPTLIPRDIALLPIEVHYNLDRVLCDQDVVIILRVQKERQKVNFFPTILEYFTLYGIDNERAFRSGKDLLIMHPGPINRGIEITPEVAESSCSAINEQVTNGLAVRMAVLYLLSGGGGGRR
jgi:aspartate carbamoyltransferase catalytic subunit